MPDIIVLGTSWRTREHDEGGEEGLEGEVEGRGFWWGFVMFILIVFSGGWGSAVDAASEATFGSVGPPV